MAKPFRISASFAAIAVAALAFCALALATPPAAFAQTATNLKCRGCVGNRDIGKDAVRSRNIKNGQVKPVDLAKSAKPAIAVRSELESDSTGGVPIVENTLLRTISLNVPAAGVVLATGTVQVLVGGIVVCIVHDAATFALNVDISVKVSSSAGQVIPVSQTRAFPVSGPGTIVIRLLCTNGGAGSPTAENPVLTAFYVPQNQGVLSG